jgi:DNA-binding response OmpR family regulator
MTRKPLALIIEDDPAQAEIFTQAIISAEYQTETFYDGEAAITRLQEVVPHIVVLDLRLPKVPGDKILQHIRTDARLVRTHVILVTASPRVAEPLREISSLVLIKPISFTQLKDLAIRLREVNATL